VFEKPCSNSHDYPWAEAPILFPNPLTERYASRVTNCEDEKLVPDKIRKWDWGCGEPPLCGPGGGSTNFNGLKTVIWYNAEGYMGQEEVKSDVRLLEG
jgi:hypothetical protein